MSDVKQISRTVLNAPIRLLRLPYTLADELRRMNERSSVGEARRAYVEDLTGFAKATAGFLVGDDRLLMRGQLERAKAAERLLAIAEDTAADSAERHAFDEESRAADEARRRRMQASVEHAARTSEIATETAHDRARAEADAIQGRNAIRRRAAGQRSILDTEEAAAREAADVIIVAAAVEEAAAEDARDEAEELERARRAGKR